MLISDKKTPTTFRQSFRDADAKAAMKAANHPDGVPSHGSLDITSGVSPLYAHAAPFGAAKGSCKDPLDTDTKSVEAKNRRFTRFRHQRGAAKILDYQHRVGLCQWAAIDQDAGVFVSIGVSEIGPKARLGGVQRCGSVWVCPCCSAVISHVRKGELNEALKWGRTHGHIPVMLTLTARHGAKDRLADLTTRIKRAKQLFHGRNGWKKMKHFMAGHITATEITNGGNGWHPHFHMLVFIKVKEVRAYLRSQGIQTHGKRSEDLAVRAMDTLLPWWLQALDDAGLDGTGAGFKVQGAAQAGAYIAKWGAGEEMTMTGAKRAKGKGRTPAQLLADAVDGNDDKAAALWSEYVGVFHGKVQLMWSRGLKDAVGIKEIKDKEAAERAEVAEALRVIIYGYEWVDGMTMLGARHRRGRILSAAENAVRDSAKTATTDAELLQAAQVAVRFVIADGGDEDGPFIEFDNRQDEVFENDDPAGWDIKPSARTDTPATVVPSHAAGKNLGGSL